MPVPASELFAWHARPLAFERLNPPFDPVTIEERTGGLAVGARTVVQMQVGPIHQRWISEHTAYEEGRSFTDEQKRGPFKSWVHQHRFVADGETRSVLDDEVHYELPVPLGRGFVDQEIDRGFVYRHALLKADLERHAKFASRRRWTIAITGASGLVGSALTAYLTTAGHTVRRVRRGANGEPDRDALEGSDAVVHLAGASIAQRWTKSHRAELVSSRVPYTRSLVEQLKRCQKKPKVLISGSAIGVYGDRGDEVLDERSAAPPRGDRGAAFLATLCADWEAAALQAADLGVRVVLLRTGVVMTANGGALAQMLPPFRVGAGGPLGSGQQYLSWVSLEDLLGAIEHALFTESVQGPMNAVAPAALTSEELTRVLGRVLMRPTFARVPRFALEVLFGEMAQGAILASQRVMPGALGASGFTFMHPELESCLRFTLGR